jgi:hypothetical protein
MQGRTRSTPCDRGTPSILAAIDLNGDHDMSDHEYNYGVFGSSPNEFMDFAVHAPKATMRAPSFPLEDLATGATVQMSELWKEGVAVIEFGSFT